MWYFSSFIKINDFYFIIKSQMNNSNSYDKRKVFYEHIHSIDEEDVKQFIKTIDIQNNQKILDACCWYWYISKHINKEIKEKNFNTRIYAFDNSDLQIKRAKQNLDKENNIEIIQSDVISMPFDDNFFDTTVIKMWLHEVTKDEQAKMLKELLRVTKTWWRICIRELSLSDKTHPIFSKFIRKKDVIWEFTSLVENRYFPKKEDILNLLKETWWEDGELSHDIYPTLSIHNRKHELISALRIKMEIEWKIDEIILEEKANTRTRELLDYATTLTTEEKEIMNYKEIIDKDWSIKDITMSAEKWIFTAQKPLK